MELLADRDPEEARKLLDPVLEYMMEAVHRYEGTVSNLMGDGIMALFGAPLAHEDHAVRACYAALRMQESVKRYADGVRRTEGVPIQIRVGLNSGEVVVGAIGNDLKMDYTAVGQTVHLASRMEQMATPGSVMITKDALQLAEGFVQVKSLGPITVKGMSEAVEVYEVTGVGATRSRLQAAAARGLTRFVGRDAETEQLRKALEQARADHGQVIGVVGEPGLGKSRLFFEFIHSHHTQGWLILESRSVSYGKATPYLPVIDFLKAYFKIQDRDDQREIRERVTGKLLTLDKSLESTLPLTKAGERNACRLGERLHGVTFAKVLTSPLQRATRTCELAGFGAVAEIDRDLLEWNYGEYEGRFTTDIHRERRDWQLFRDGCPGGESPKDVGMRALRAVKRIREVDGDVLVFSSGHFLRVFAARWLGLDAAFGRYFLLSTASISLLGYEHNLSEPVIRLWDDTGHLEG